MKAEKKAKLLSNNARRAPAPTRCLHLILLVPALLLISLTVSAGILTAQSLSLEGEVVHVADGDTLDVRRDGGEELTIRLDGVDCPESNQPYGDRAEAFLRARVLGEQVRVEIVDKDRYGRYIGIIEISRNGRELNSALVDAGLAWWYRRYAPDKQHLERLEDEARRAGKGLWSQENPIAPWDWRRGKRPE